VKGGAHEVLSILAAAIQITVGWIFVSAGAHKAFRWHAFKGMLDAYRLLPACLLSVAATATVIAELLTGFALVAGWNVPVFSFIAAGLLALFAAAMAINLARGRTSIDCGCFQSIRQPLEWRLVVRNLVCAVAVLSVSGFSVSLYDSPRWVHAFPASVALFAIYLALNSVWALDASRAVALAKA
jgi:uncharacterized membrane protein YphA (DoxX/SURF4 family)